MLLLEVPIFKKLVFLTIVCVIVSLSPRRRSEAWLVVMVILLFALPRAGFTLMQFILQLPLAHWLNLFSRLSIPGVLAIVILLVVLFKYVWTRARSVQDTWVKAFLIGTLAGFVGQWLIWGVNNTYMLPGGGLNFWFMFGMLVAGSRAFTEPNYPVYQPFQSGGSMQQVMSIPE